MHGWIGSTSKAAVEKLSKHKALGTLRPAPVPVNVLEFTLYPVLLPPPFLSKTQIACLCEAAVPSFSLSQPWGLTRACGHLYGGAVAE
jgi:hypothetical protein